MKTKLNHEIEALLLRFEAGETSLAEEERLALLLAQPEYKKQYPEEAALFSYFNQAKNQNENDSLVKQMFEKHDLPIQRSTAFKHQWKTATKYAAILIVALSAMFFTSQYQQQQQKEEAKLAYLATKKALYIISNEMNTATQNLSTIEEVTKETQLFINY